MLPANGSDPKALPRLQSCDDATGKISDFVASYSFGRLRLVLLHFTGETVSVRTGGDSESFRDSYHLYKPPSKHFFSVTYPCILFIPFRDLLSSKLDFYISKCAHTPTVIASLPVIPPKWSKLISRMVHKTKPMVSMAPQLSRLSKNNKRGIPTLLALRTS